MKKNMLRTHAIMGACAILLIASVFVSCSTTQAQESSIYEASWSETLCGNDQTLQYYPDIFANYWDFAFSPTANPNVGIKITGQFPLVRFFNFVLYEEVGTRDDLDSIEDWKLVADKGSVNPFLEETADPSKNTYTLYLLPDNTPQAVKDKVPNAMYFPATEYDAISVVLRYYIPTEKDGATYDEFASVPLPTITGVDSRTLKPVAAPQRVFSLIHNLPKFDLEDFGRQPIAVFLRARTGETYPNRPTEYLYTVGALNEGDVLAFRFKPATAPADVSEYETADVRYWSICAGNSDTYSYTSLYDSQCKVSPEGWSTFLMVDPASKNYAAIVAKAQASDEINIVDWPRAEAGDGFMVLYRNMIINPSYEHTIEHVQTFYNDPKNPGMPTPAQMGNLVLGDYGPVGKLYPETAILSDSFTIEDIRIMMPYMGK